MSIYSLLRVRLLVLLADMIFFFFYFSFYSLFFIYLFILFLFLSWPHKKGIFIKELGFHVLLMTWRPIQGTLYNNARVSFSFFGLLVVSTWSYIPSQAQSLLSQGRFSSSMMWTPHSPHVHVTFPPSGSRAMSSYKGWLGP